MREIESRLDIRFLKKRSFFKCVNDDSFMYFWRFPIQLISRVSLINFRTANVASKEFIIKRDSKLLINQLFNPRQRYDQICDSFLENGFIVS